MVVTLARGWVLALILVSLFPQVSSRGPRIR